MSYIPKAFRLFVSHRAAFRCEYCKVPDLGFAFPFQIDHIRAIKHNGLTVLSNLAYCCPDCNRYKGTDPGSYLDESPALIRFYNPRTDIWEDHFGIDDGIIYPKTQEGQVTVLIFQFNLPERIIYRQELVASDLY